MSNVMFLLFARHQVQDFVAAHPQEDGWTVYNFCNDSTRELYLEGLADFLREKYPGAVKRSSVAKELSMETVRRIAHSGPVIDLGSDGTLREKLDSEGWFGSVEIEWNDSPIHIQSIFMDQCLAKEPLVLIAAKSNAALRGFLNALRQYGDSREAESQEILVVNGINLAKPKTSWDEVVCRAPSLTRSAGTSTGFFRALTNTAKADFPTGGASCSRGLPDAARRLPLELSPTRQRRRRWPFYQSPIWTRIV